MIWIRNAIIVDPVHKRNGEPGDLWMDKGRIIEAPQSLEGTGKVIDGTGLVMMAGGIDLHSHIAGPPMQAGRILQHSHAGSGIQTVPTEELTGQLYAQMGYTTVSEAAMLPVWADQTHLSFGRIPVLDKMAYLAVGSHRRLLDLLARKEYESARSTLACWLNVCGAYALKAVNPNDPEDRVTYEDIVDFLLDGNEEMGLAHGLHLHGKGIGKPGNGVDCCESIRLSGGRRLHLAHLQFHSYGGKTVSDWSSASEQVLKCLGDFPHVTVDAGLVHFGKAMTMTTDIGFSRYLWSMNHGRVWFHQFGENGSFGTFPVHYRQNNRVNAVQWMTGLELILLSDNLWQISLSTDHPNGAPFTALPELIRCLMSEGYRRKYLEQCSPKLRESGSLWSISRELSLYEVAILTRGAPAKTLGLQRWKGHLAPGADGDVVLYGYEGGQVDFSRARYLWKNGKMIIENGNWIGDTPGCTLSVRPEYPTTMEIPGTSQYAIDREVWKACRVMETRKADE